MGQGRRMGKKQGPPEPLSEAHFAKLKRKAGLPADPPAEAPTPKKRRTGKSQEPAKTNGSKAQSKKPAPKKTNGLKSLDSEPKKTKKATAKKAPQPDSDSDEILDDEFDLDDAEGLDDLDEDDLDNQALGDDFLGSDDDSGFDSDQEPLQKEKFEFSDDEEDSDREERLTAANIEGLSAKLDRQLEEEAEEAEADLRESALQTNIDGDRPKILGEDDEDEGEGGDRKKKSTLAPNLQLLRTRITETIRVLESFKELAEEGRSRSEYIEQILNDICDYYGYSPFLAEKLFNLFSPSEAFAFFEANESARPVVIRTNTLRTHRRDLAQALINRGVTLEPVGKWSKVGLQIFDSQVPLGATPEYLAGHYILQAASSFLPTMALCPQENERILDMAAAPGGKTTHLAALMKNTGIIFANDPSKSRSKGLIGNVHRLGCRNVVVCNYDAREIPKILSGFDRVLLDAPCSGTGVISKDPSVKTNKDERDFQQLPHTQRQLILAAIDCLKVGGHLVYSTCSVTVEENEQVVAYALRARPNVRLVETGLPFGVPGFTSYGGKKFHPSVKMTRRYYPHTYNVDGFFVSKFQKFAQTPANAPLAGNNMNKKNERRPEAVVADEDDEDVHAPVTEESETSEDNGKTGQQKKDEFGGFDEDEDDKYIERAKRNAMRRRGLDPRALNQPNGAGKPQGQGVGKKDKSIKPKDKTKSNGAKSNGAKAKSS
ncbi:NOL1/NOP2/sun family putative RNA met [Thozetella sp. PMI_491]|nr:NOL1/NOP2/sun family putative RNA met [Thozetella sp. PMI_491]